ncbi:alpha/beta fold hydrolase [Micromonospora soli]|uniref:lipase family alpha/beta hydrolase n=1 Tax=Micromonospora sp. NBRC 110009 TaxID=3061627 RepID=UPI00267121DB|nr:alpha/beta fold hydrolase [Micromonospora sp. NBRC 110009]WKT96587.1 alpha/beta fold hydrolase [Micromonospora sp. NBRC 110009]
MLLRTILAATTAVTALLVPAAAQAAPHRATTTAGVADEPTTTTAGVADEPTTTTGTLAAAANPVVVVGGLIGISIAYEPIAARLRADGYRVSIFQLPNLGFGDIRESARALSAYVDQVRAATGAARVDLVTHSEGGLVGRWYVKFLGGADKVDRYLSLGTPQYGTYVADLINFLGLGSCAGIVACQQMTTGSSFLADLNGGDDTPGPVRWTTVRTWQDELVRPVDNASLADGATNVLVQAWCPLRVVGHLGLVLDGTTYTVVRQALADAAIRPNCFAL